MTTLSKERVMKIKQAYNMCKIVEHLEVLQEYIRTNDEEYTLAFLEKLEEKLGAVACFSKLLQEHVETHKEYLEQLSKYEIRNK